MLNEMRFGNLSRESIAKFRSLSRKIDYKDGIGPTELYLWNFPRFSELIYSSRFPRRDDVERSNTNRMETLKTNMQTFTALDGGSIQDPTQREKLLSNFMAPHQLILKVDAQVMLIKNVDETLVNGTMGRVLRFIDPSTFGTEAEADLSGVITGSGLGSKKGPSNAAGISAKGYPVVEFILPQERTRRVLVMPETWKVELPNGEVQVSRTQVSLYRLSWRYLIQYLYF
jgi:ATP-dependent DNA helicase PIF1